MQRNWSRCPEPSLGRRVGWWGAGREAGPPGHRRPVGWASDQGPARLPRGPSPKTPGAAFPSTRPGACLSQRERVRSSTRTHSVLALRASPPRPEGKEEDSPPPCPGGEGRRSERRRCGHPTLGCRSLSRPLKVLCSCPPPGGLAESARPGGVLVPERTRPASTRTHSVLALRASPPRPEGEEEDSPPPSPSGEGRRKRPAAVWASHPGVLLAKHTLSRRDSGRRRRPVLCRLALDSDPVAALDEAGHQDPPREVQDVECEYRHARPPVFQPGEINSRDTPHKHPDNPWGVALGSHRTDTDQRCRLLPVDVDTKEDIVMVEPRAVVVLVRHGLMMAQLSRRRRR